MTSPISYYGGKKTLASTIIDLFPHHDQYVEPFFGGGAVFFAKSPTDNETINDMDGRVINFYRCCADPNEFNKLQQRIKSTLHTDRIGMKRK